MSSQSSTQSQPFPFLDQALNINLMQSLIKTDNNSTCFWNTFVKYVLLIGQDQFKTLFKSITDKLSCEIQKANFTSLFQLYNLSSGLISNFFVILKPIVWIYKSIKSLFVKEDVEFCFELLEFEKIQSNSIFFPMEFKQCFWESILKSKNSNYISYNQDIVSLTQQDKNSLIVKEKFSNIVISTDDFEATLMCPIELKFLNSNGVKTIQKCVNLPQQENNLYPDVDYYDWIESQVSKVSNMPLTPKRKIVNTSVMMPNKLILKNLVNLPYVDMAAQVRSMSGNFFKTSFPEEQYEKIYFKKCAIDSSLLNNHKAKLYEIYRQLNLTLPKEYENKNTTAVFTDKMLQKINFLYGHEKKITCLNDFHQNFVKSSDYTCEVVLDYNDINDTFHFFMLLMLLYPETRLKINEVNVYINKMDNNQNISKYYFNIFNIYKCMSIKEDNEIIFCNMFNMPMKCGVHKIFIHELEELVYYISKDNKSTVLLNRCKDKIEKFFAETPFLGGINGLKQLINYLFKSSSFKSVPFPELEANNIKIDEGPINTINISLSSDTISNKVELQNKFINFCQTICNQIASENEELKKISVYTISIDRQEIVTKKTNPEYEMWKTNFDRLKEIESKDEKVLETIAKFSTTAPNEFVDDIKIKKSVKCTSINQVQKDISTMYLSLKDKTTLTSLLYLFKNNKKKIEKLGLPNKLGILLYGLPGCGKTSTVIAAATYLQKDIYYLNLNGVKTNEDLGMLFDYVVKETTTSGIMVMEDIDAMTQVVHKREEDSYKNQRASTAAELIENNESPLTLEYFLNILQGTLTRDNSVFIATTNHLEVLDPAFYRPGRFDIKIEMKPADHYQIEQIYQTFFERSLNHENLKRIKEYKYTPAQFIFKFAEYIMNPNASDDEILGEFYES